MDKRIVLTTTGSGDNGKTSALISMAYMLVQRGYPVLMISFDPEPENDLTLLLASSLAKGQSIPDLTIVDLLKMPFAKTGKAADDMAFAIKDATLNHPAGFGIIRVDIELINYEVEGGDIMGLRRVIEHCPNGFILIDCAAGSGGFSMLSAVAAADYVIAVSKPSTKSISIAKRTCGIGGNEDDSIISMVTMTTDDGLICQPKYIGVIGNMFIGARLNGDGKIEIAKSGISANLRSYMDQIINLPGFLGHVPFRTGSDQSEVIKAYDRITSEVLRRIGVTS